MEKYKDLTENEKKIIDLLSWAYKQGFDAAVKTLAETSKVIDIEKMKDGFVNVIMQGKQEK